jgi:hypothetical protein
MVTVVVVVDTNLIPAPRSADAPQRRGRRANAGLPVVRARRSSGRRSSQRPGRPSTLRAREPLTATALVLAVALAVLPWSGTDHLPAAAAATLWMLAGVPVLRPAFLLLHAGIAGAAVTVATTGAVPAMPAAVLCLVVLDGMVLGYGTSRWSTDAQLALGESMLGALREGLHAQGVIPPLEPGWQVETALRPAYGDAFSGDFLVARRREHDAEVEIALVDVSGKGRGAGARALLLSGAFGGMLGELPADGFLAAANRFVLRQEWHEGFATAVHAWVDLSGGAFRVTGAGHPPAARFHAGTGRWELFGGEQGPLLGVVEGAQFPSVAGRLNRGDALLLYTDGLVEVPGRDVQLGIDRLLGQAERVMTRGFHGGAAAIMDAAPGGNSDDRALVLIWRT